jgi:hypothetical protein
MTNHITPIPLTATEEWYDIPSLDGWYQASNLGQVRSVDRVIHCANGQTRYWQGRVLNPKIASTGYYMVVLRHNRKSIDTTIHSLVAAAFHGPCPPKHIVHHVDANKLNNLPENLRYVHVSAHVGIHNSGKPGYPRKLTPELVRQIRSLLKQGGISHKRIATKFGIGQAAVSDIRRKVTWAWLDD